MSHAHKDHSAKEHQHKKAEQRREGMRPHVKWIVVVGCVLMLGAMIIYILTLDESIRPGNPSQQSTPALP